MTDTQKVIAIQCLLIRPNGTEIDLYGNHYHFKPESDHPKAKHVAAIPFDHAAAIHRLLSITVGYALVDPKAELPPYAKAAPMQTIHTDKVAAATEAPVAVVPVSIEGPDGKTYMLTDMERPELAQFAAEHFQIKVHYKWVPATIIAKILEAMRAPDED